MSGDSVEIGKIEVNGATVYSVRIIKNGRVETVKDHCNSLDEAEALAKKEAATLQIKVTRGYGIP